MHEIKICPFRTYTEVRPAILKGQGDVTVTGFMDCLKRECPALRIKKTPRTGYGRIDGYDESEHCLRLEGEKK